LSNKKNIVLIAYSGHSFVVYDILKSQNEVITSYCDSEEKANNPFLLQYLGKESSEIALAVLQNDDYFVCIGNNSIRRKVQENMTTLTGKAPINAIHQKSTISPTATLGNGAMVSAGVVINSLSNIGDGVICNTNCTVEHESVIGKFVHIGPGAVLCGNVHVGENTFIGANTVIKQGTKIGKNVMIGAGAVVIEDIPDNCTAVGNPCKIIRNES
jgi:sugar O-acyltransferase (sialic acid O-acetyltransferase NeuD family)